MTILFLAAKYTLKNITICHAVHSKTWDQILTFSKRFSKKSTNMLICQITSQTLLPLFYTKHVP